MRTHSIVCMILASALTSVAGVCPGGYTEVVGVDRCYRVYTDQLSYRQGETVCGTDGAQLAAPDSPEKSRALAELVWFSVGSMQCLDSRADRFLYACTFHLGATRDAMSDEWTWEDGQNVTYTHWLTGEPNSAAAAVLTGVFSHSQDGNHLEWDDRSSPINLGFICERKN